MPAARPPISDTTMVSAMKAKVKFEAGVRPRRGTSATAMNIAASGPLAR